MIEIVFETHSITEDNEAGLATGWKPGRLAPAGRQGSAELGDRRRDDGVDAVFSSDLGRAVETATIAFGDTDLPVLLDWRLRECDYGERNGGPVAEIHARRDLYLEEPYPGGESWRQAVERVGRFLDDLPLRWEGKRVVVIGHVATRWGFDQFIGGTPIDDLVHADFEWQEGWEYRLG
ncbi:MAG: histidine phosphatase family protein [Actinomycetota bacterium]